MCNVSTKLSGRGVWPIISWLGQELSMDRVQFTLSLIASTGTVVELLLLEPPLGLRLFRIPAQLGQHSVTQSKRTRNLPP